MNYTNALLDRVKAMFNLTSEYQLAKFLEVPYSSLHRWRKGQNSMEWDTAFRICDLLNEDDQNVVYGLIDDKYSNPRLINALHDGRAH
ncbi:transcriptional regulator [Vibrio fluvialis]|uniref:transcriptional regulator n=1 Tax=Vibrio fluvialis TaxID=676 RepID=UPI0024E009BF|nr:transcriptional regulator [Vibrio fluvialis]ELE8117801.1 helix-turn-helix transcriptional regulator [Vibrio fluvialis]ELL4666592.1 helix-turn-helix transcriptional regulator [Vibrio fluvialis]WIE06153.1 transcriptional regulator [Vibrio fluvialis]